MTAPSPERKRDPDLPGFDPVGGDDRETRLAWRRLVHDRLPRAAPDRNWPVSEDHCFARILLDAAIGKPWREQVRPPAWKNTPIAILRDAIALGEAVLAGTQDLHALNDLSLMLRGKKPRSVRSISQT